MGYSYQIILQKFSNGAWEDVEKYGNSGSFSARHYHYFLLKSKTMNFMIDKNDYEKDYVWYEFDADDVVKEHSDYLRLEEVWKDRAREIVEKSETIDETMSGMENLKYELTIPSYWDELDTWVGKIRKSRQSGDEKLRILFGFCP
jgi:predicted AlkP superfamily phosphohydrolase/phosphomutase